MVRRLVVNWFGGPSIGKTTAAAEMFVALKKNDIEVEMVSEFAKDQVVEGAVDSLRHQWYITGTQAYRIDCAYRSMQVVITDSPILLAPIYDFDHDASSALKDLSLEHHAKYNNLNILLSRSPEFNHTMAGRVHSLTESITIDNRILHFLDNHEIPYVKFDEYGMDRIVQLVLREITR
jgi:hypothetical protein